ncbi:hypothetical protein GOODEAATRI_029430 [Goodea atripinnis]|uniref:Uncharacterized protein n=1 Tax=Goodea atripinnis TaxID=208336 RepID=A0ABV0P8S7_9TELE
MCGQRPHLRHRFLSGLGQQNYDKLHTNGDANTHRKRASLESQTLFCWTVFQEKSRISSSMQTLRSVVPQRPTTEQSRPRP